MVVVASFLDAVGIGAVPTVVAALAVPEQVFNHRWAGPLVESLGIQDDRDLVLWACFGLVLAFVVKNSFLALVYYFEAWVSERLKVKLADQLFRGYLMAPLEFHVGRNSSELLRNVQQETRQVVVSVIEPAISVIMGAMMSLVIITLLTWVAPMGTAVAVAIVGSGSWLFLYVSKNRLHRLGAESLEYRRRALAWLLQGLEGVVPARMAQREGYFAQAHRRSYLGFARASRESTFINKLANPALETIAVAGLVSIVLLSVLRESALSALMPLLALFAVAIVRLRATVSQVVAGISRVRFGSASIHPVFEDLTALRSGIGTLEARETGQVARHDPLTVSMDIELDSVCYRYPGSDVPALESISLTIPRGSSAAFVGPTGSGKTTLANIILGLLSPESGRLLVDGRDVQEQLTEWQLAIGYIPQTIFLLDDSIRANIAFGVPAGEVDDALVNGSLAMAQLDTFIQQLKDGVNTVVGERGVRLSGGQRQRIGLARAFYGRPQVLVLDEATSALDNETEGLVMQALSDAHGNRTSIMIAHRLTTVRNCDTLYFMRDGRIEASGTYEELSIRHPAFRRMATHGVHSD